MRVYLSCLLLLEPVLLLGQNLSPPKIICSIVAFITVGGETINRPQNDRSKSLLHHFIHSVHWFEILKNETFLVVFFTFTDFNSTFYYSTNWKGKHTFSNSINYGWT